MSAEEDQAAAHKKNAFHFATLGSASIAKGNFAEGIALLQQSLTFKPDFAEVYCNLGLAQHRIGHLQDAAESYQRAVALKPDFHLALFNLGGVYRDQGKLSESILAYERSIALKPDFHQAYDHIAKVLHEQGRLEEAVRFHEQAIALKPDDLKAYSGLIYTLLASQMRPQAEILAVARRYGAVLGPPPPAMPLPPRDGGKTRIGIMTAELGNHAVSFFLESYLRHYDRRRYEVTLYLSVMRPETQLTALTDLCDHVRVLEGVSDDDACIQIRGDALHVLVETSAHTRGGRLPLMARRCAPIQCHYLGASGSTGVAAMDYFIGDDEITPAAFQENFSERLYRLANLWMVYRPPTDLPAASSLSPDGEIVLGCFNTLMKVREETLRVWALVLKAIPHAKILLKDKMTADPYTRGRIHQVMTSLGVAADRIVFAGHTAHWRDHMAFYNHVDIALDTCPLSSGSTGFDAVFMGTPLVAMRGNWLGGRMSSSMLKALGRPEWVAETPDEYVRVVQRLAADKAALRRYKETLREDVFNSPLCDGPSVAAALEQAFDRMIANHAAATPQS